MERAPRNKTLVIEPSDFSNENIIKYLSKELCEGHIANGDTFELLKDIKEPFADLIILDPPYNLSKKFDNMQFDSMSNDEYIDYLESWVPNIEKCLKPGGSLYFCCDWKCSIEVYQVLKKYFKVMNRITWKRDKGRGAKSNWKNNHEDIYYCVSKKSGEVYFDLESVKIRRKVLARYKEDGVPKDWDEKTQTRLTYPSNLWDDITIPFWSMSENTDHPTQKPEKLIAKIILASCPENGIVFDPFAGSGTSLVVAKKLNRKFLGIEYSENYCMYCAKRLYQAETNDFIQGYENKEFKDRNM